MGFIEVSKLFPLCWPCTLHLFLLSPDCLIHFLRLPFLLCLTTNSNFIMSKEEHIIERCCLSDRRIMRSSHSHSLRDDRIGRGRLLLGGWVAACRLCSFPPFSLSFSSRPFHSSFFTVVVVRRSPSSNKHRFPILGGGKERMIEGQGHEVHCGTN